MQEKYKELRALAEEATPGPWKMFVLSSRSGGGGVPFIETLSGTRVASLNARRVDVAYMAAASPDVVLGLLDRIADLESTPKLQTSITFGGAKGVSDLESVGLGGVTQYAPVGQPALVEPPAVSVSSLSDVTLAANLRSIGVVLREECKPKMAECVDAAAQRLQGGPVPAEFLELYDHAFGLATGSDWNSGLSAKAHRGALVEAVQKCTDFFAYTNYPGPADYAPRMPRASLPKVDSRVDAVSPPLLNVSAADLDDPPAVMRAAREAWLALNGPLDGTDCVTPYDMYLYEPAPIPPQESGALGLIKTLELKYNFICAGGPLSHCTEWQQLKREVEVIEDNRIEGFSRAPIIRVTEPCESNSGRSSVKWAYLDEAGFLSSRPHYDTPIRAAFELGKYAARLDMPKPPLNSAVQPPKGYTMAPHCSYPYAGLKATGWTDQLLVSFGYLVKLTE